MFKNDADFAPSLHFDHDKLGPGRNKSHQERDRRTEEIGEQKPEREREKKWSKKNVMHSLRMKWMLIGATRQRFSILLSILPIQYMKSTPGDIPLVDKIVLICSA